MRYHFLLLILFTGVLFGQNKRIESNDIRFYGPKFFCLEGTAFPDSLKQNRYHRLPAYFQKLVREPVWELSKSSAGLSIRFKTNSKIIKAKWEVVNDLKMDHMPETGIKGIDLYYKNGKGWQYVNTGRPTGKSNQQTLIENMTRAEREYLIFLPLYDELKLLEIGVDAESSIVAPDKNTQRPIVFYGTSITQGGCASRPGMVHTNIMSRKLDREVLNFGFSGNGTMDKSIAELISMIDAEIYIIECMPNMLISENVLERTIPLVDIIREKQPTTPIVFVGLFPTAYSFLNAELFDESKKLDNALKTEFQKMIDRGYDNLFYVDGGSALGHDYEGTVDGLHFTDLGFLRYANFLLTELKDNKLLD